MIYWLSQHDPLPAQREALRRIFGPEGQHIVHDPSPFGDAEEILARYQRSGCKEIVIVAPESVIRRLIELGVRPIRARMRQVNQFTNPNTQTVSAPSKRGQRIWEFEGFDRILGYRIEVEPLEGGIYDRQIYDRQ